MPGFFCKTIAVSAFQLAIGFNFSGMKLAEYFLLQRSGNVSLMWTQSGSAESGKGQMAFMNTLSACLNKAVAEGYRECFTVTGKGLYSTSRSRYYRPEQVQVLNFYRFEGQSDPADNAIMYLLETSDGLKGTLIDAYGTYSDGSIGRFMTEVEEIRKKINGHNRHYA
jgi:hypothetical protein